MASLNQDFVLWEGESKTIIFDVVDENGVPLPVNLGSTVKWIMQKSATDINGRILKSTTDGITLSTNAEGGLRISVFLEPQDTASKSPGTYYHEVRVIDTALNETVAAIGKVTLKPSATDTI